jgi:hypothetical protein
MPDLERVELSDPPAVITKYWCLLDAIGHAKSIITRREASLVRLHGRAV